MLQRESQKAQEASKPRSPTRAESAELHSNMDAAAGEDSDEDAFDRPNHSDLSGAELRKMRDGGSRWGSGKMKTMVAMSSFGAEFKLEVFNVERRNERI